MVQDKLRNRPEMAQDRHRISQDKPKSRNIDLQGDPERLQNALNVFRSVVSQERCLSMCSTYLRMANRLLALVEVPIASATDSSLLKTMPT